MFRIRPSLPRPSRLPTAARTRWFSNQSISTRAGVNSHWNKETLATTEKYPLSLELLKKAHPKTEEPAKKQSKGHARHKKKTATVNHARTQIVSPDLCDDVLKYYGKHLEAHKGCDILDINPGAGLWSQKLHEFLQPRSHVLMEPNPDRWKPFLDPLLDAPNSKYKLVQKDTIELDSYTELINEGVFPNQTRVDPASDSKQELNKTLLVTGMLVWDPRLPGMAFDSMAKQLYNLFSSAVRTNDYFHAYGRVRTLFWVSSDDFRSMLAESSDDTQNNVRTRPLFWVSSDDFRSMLAESSASFAKNNCLLEMTQQMDLIVNGSRGPRGLGKAAPGREPAYEIESTVRALQRGRETGMALPTHRQDTIHEIAAEIEKLSDGTGRSQSSSWLHGFLEAKHLEGKTPTGLLTEAYFEHADRTIALQNKYPEFDLSEMGNARGTTKRVANFWKGREDHPGRDELHSFILTKAADRALLAKKDHHEYVADVGEELYDSECRALRLKDGPKKDALLKKIEELDAQWYKLVSALAANYKAAPTSILDDRLSMRAPPYPRLQWDRRTFEPLTMRPDEAWPPARLALVSSTPFPRPAGETVDWSEWVHDFVYALFAIPSQSLPEALDKLQHGASQIMEDCPALTDPAKGGRMNLKHLRVRMLTSEMIEQLVKAYRDWPFKEPGSDHNKYFRWKGMNKGIDSSRGL